jgi:hypothetical protein
MSGEYGRNSDLFVLEEFRERYDAQENVRFPGVSSPRLSQPPVCEMR